MGGTLVSEGGGGASFSSYKYSLCIHPRGVSGTVSSPPGQKLPTQPAEGKVHHHIFEDGGKTSANMTLQSDEETELESSSL